MPISSAHSYKPLRILPGLFGMAVILYALGWCGPTTQRWLFLTGSLAMLLTAVWERHRLLSFLQLIVISGNIAAFIPAPPPSRALIPLTVCFPVLLWLWRSHLLGTPNARIGAGALLLLSVGYSIQHPIGLAAGGTALSLYALLEFHRGFQPAALWLVLNLVFALMALRQLL